MGYRDHTTRRAPGNPLVLSRDGSGNEHYLRVADHPAGMVSIVDDEMIRILSPDATVNLITSLLSALGGLVPPAPRRLS